MRSTKMVTLTVGALAALTAPAAAAWQDGNQLYEECTEKTGFAFGYIEGVVDALGRSNGGFCIPPSVIAGQLRDVVCSELRQNPKDRDRPAAALVFSALKRAWPCK